MPTINRSKPLGQFSVLVFIKDRYRLTDEQLYSYIHIFFSLFWAFYCGIRLLFYFILCYFKIAQTEPESMVLGTIVLLNFS